MKTNFMKLTVLSLLLVVMLATSVVTLAQDPVTLRMTGLSGASGRGLQALIPVWNENNPDIQVELELQADEINWQATAPSTMFVADDGPDLSWWWCSPTFQYKEMIGAGILAPLNDLYENEGWNDAYPEGTLNYFTEPDGNRYGINIDVVWTPYIYYNKEIFAEVGVEPPTTWEELYAIADAVREAGYQPLVTFYDFGLTNHLPDALMLRSWTPEEYQAFLVNWSADAPAEALEHKWTDPNGVRIFQTLKDMVDRGLLADGFAGLTEYEASKGLFTSGRAAMYQMGSWEGGNGGLEAAVDFEFDYFYYPNFDGAAHDPYGPVGSWIPNCYIAFNREDVEASKQVISWLASPEAMEIYTEASGLTPGRTDLDEAAVAEILNPMTAQMVSDVGSMGAPALYEGAVPPDVLSALKQAADLLLNGALTPEEAAQMVQDATEEAREG